MICRFMAVAVALGVAAGAPTAPATVVESIALSSPNVLEGQTASAIFKPSNVEPSTQGKITNLACVRKVKYNM